MFEVIVAPDVIILKKFEIKANTVPTVKIIIIIPTKNIKVVALKDKYPLIHKTNKKIERLEKIIPILILRFLNSTLLVRLVCVGCISTFYLH